jgi:ABC-type uncharacterized transport system auxiliary subunit
MIKRPRVRLATIVILLAAALSFAGCETESYDDQNYRAAVEEAQTAQRHENFVHTPP